MMTHTAPCPRVLRFPMDEPVGILYGRPGCVPCQPSARWRCRTFLGLNGWKPLGGARGVFDLSGYEELGLKIDPGRVPDFASLNALPLDQFQMLSFGGSPLSDHQIASLRPPTTLKYLDFHLDDFWQTTWSCHTHNERTGCSSTRDPSINGVADEAMQWIGSLPSLERLDLEDTEVSIGPLTRLQTLDLGGTQVTDQGLSYLASLGDLRVLNLFQLDPSASQISDSAVRNLQQSLPQVRINRGLLDFELDLSELDLDEPDLSSS